MSAYHTRAHAPRLRALSLPAYSLPAHTARPPLPCPPFPPLRYNELSTLTIKKTSATTQSVANTAKRVIVIVGVALALGESLEPLKMIGCGIGIGGVLLYSLVK